MHGQHKSVIEIILTILSTLVVIAALTYWMVRVRDKHTMINRVVATLGLCIGFYFVIRPAFVIGGYAAIGGLFILVAWGWAMAIIWVPAVTGSLGGLFGSLYDGGNEEVEAKPFYSIFNSKRQQGKYFEALTEIRGQLEKFPNDFQGIMLLAELQAENLDDLPGAEITVDKLSKQPGQAPLNVAYALNRVADWHLGLTRDRDAAQRALEKIIQLFPDTDLSQRAAQRIAHLADAEMLLAPHDRRRIAVKKGPENLGLIREQGKLKVPETDYAAEAQGYAEHLARHPQDNDAREKLAVLYAKHYHRIDLAADQLEQMIAQPTHSPKQIVHWLNLLADLQVHEGAAFLEIQSTLQRIVDAYPNLPAADNAQRRIALLAKELKSREEGPRSVHLGTYEQNIGLKRP